MLLLDTTSNSTPKLAQSASRRSLLKGIGALFGTGVLAAPGHLLAAPALASAGMASAGGDEYIGMVKLLTGTTVPAGWLPCDGRELPVAGHPALFALMGTTYGGNGRHTFALPDMRADMATMAAAVARQPAGATPLGQLCAVKVANAPALTTAVAELRLVHQRRPRAQVA